MPCVDQYALLHNLSFLLLLLSYVILPYKKSMLMQVLIAHWPRHKGLVLKVLPYHALLVSPKAPIQNQSQQRGAHVAGKLTSSDTLAKPVK